MQGINFNSQVEGMYTLKVYDAATKKLKKEIGPFKNKITTLGLNKIGTNGVFATHIYVGTGTVPATFADTTMSSQKAASSTSGPGDNVSTSASLANPYVTLTIVKRFAPGVAAGNLTEVGIGWAANPLNSLWSRELIVDGGGNPVTLTVLPSEYLDVIYTLRYYISTADSTGSFTLNSVVYNYTLRTASISSSDLRSANVTAGAPVLLNAYTGTIGAVTGTPSGTVANNIASSVEAAYVNNSFALEATSTVAMAAGNIAGGIKSLLLEAPSGYCVLGQRWQMELDKTIPKTSTNSFTMTLRRTWSRYP